MKLNDIIQHRIKSQGDGRGSEWVKQAMTVTLENGLNILFQANLYFFLYFRTTLNRFGHVMTPIAGK